MGPTDRPNVFVLSADSLRANAFASLMGDVPGLIDGVAFTNAVSTANATGSSMPSLVGGVYSETVHAATWALKFGESSPPDSESTGRSPARARLRQASSNRRASSRAFRCRERPA